MALIACPECGREVSNSAAACPSCAYPVATGIQARTAGTDTRSKWRERAKLAASIGARLLGGMILIGFGVDGNHQEAGTAAIIGGIIVAVSSIPTWYRARLGRSVRSDPDGLGDRLATMEDRHRQQMAELARMQADRVADLEERIDFTERLLTKQREQLNP